MSDKLDWLDRHLIMIRHVTLRDVVDKENYKIRPDLAELFVGVEGAEEMVFKFAHLGRYKCACELLASLAHHRAAVWWGYRCVVSLLEELEKNPAADRDIAEIGASFEVKVPGFAQVKPPAPDPAAVAKMQADLAKAQAQVAALQAKVDPAAKKMLDEGVERGYQKFKSIHGIHPLDLIKKLGGRLQENPRPIDPASPIFQEAAKIKAQLGAIQKETVDTIKSVIPPKVPEHEKKVRDNALDAVYRWVVSPDEENSKKCLDIGNECPDTPAGLLALSAFWAFGNLMPGGEDVIPTPPGLAANGLCQVLLMCALHKGGTRKVKERYEHYFNLGVEVIGGGDTWEERLVEETAPHRMILPHTGPAEKNPAGEYRRWKK